MNQVAARNQVSYEVYIKDRSGRWQIHAHYSGAQKKQAEEEAKQLERASHVSAVKVIREVYNHATNSADDYVIYETRTKSKPGPAAAQGKPPAARPTPSPSATDSAPRKPEPPRERESSVRSRRTDDESQSIIGLALKLMIAFCIAIAIGLAAMLTAAKGLEFLPDMGISISQGFYDKANFISFAVGFLASAVPILMSLTKKFKGRSTSQPDARHAQPVQHGAKTSRSVRAKTAREALSTAGMSAAEMAAEMAREDKDDNPTEPNQKAEANSESASETEDTPKAPLVETREMRTTREQMKAFISGSMAAIRQNLPQLDAYHKFGVNLYVAGACDACSEKNALDLKDGRTVLRDCISALGANKSMAETFCKNVDSYILEPKYRDMYGAGRKSMDAYEKNEESVGPSIKAALANWNEKPLAGAPAAGGKKLHALMFTDIVNSTALTQELGDHGAQQMVHLHNQIVRTALINNYGKEVKHMGDGIMAVFPSSASSVEAAIEIQKNMASHNATHDLKFQIRIGINAGEAIAEENDLFGSVVQLAARVCAQASGDETLVSEHVKNTYSGNRATFVSQGKRKMKGFSDPIEVFAVQSRV